MSRAKTTRYASEDHASDLLAEIMDETEHDAAAEARDREESIRRAKEEESARQAAEQSALMAERKARLARELERQDQLERKRAERREALAAAAGLPADDELDSVEQSSPSVTVDEEAIRRQIAEEVRDELRAIGMTPMPALEPEAATPHRSSHGLIMGVLGTAVAAGAALTFFATTAYTPDTTSYAKAVFAPADHSVAALEVSFTPIPVEEPAVAEPEPEVRPKRIKRVTAASPTPKEAKKSKSAFGQPTKTSKERDAYNKLLNALDNAPDPFSAD